MKNLQRKSLTSNTIIS